MTLKHDIKLMVGMLKFDALKWWEDYQTTRKLSKRYPNISPYNVGELFEAGYADVSSDLEKALSELPVNVNKERLN